MVQNIDNPQWDLPSAPDALVVELTARRDEVARMATERDRLALESARC